MLLAASMDIYFFLCSVRTEYLLHTFMGRNAVFLFSSDQGSTNYGPCPTASICRYSFTGTKSWSFISVLSVAAFTPQGQFSIAIETTWPAKPQIFTIWSFIKKVCWSMFQTKTRQHLNKKYFCSLFLFLIWIYFSQFSWHYLHTFQVKHLPMVWYQNQSKHNLLCITTQLQVHSQRVGQGSTYWKVSLLSIVSFEPQCSTVIHIFECFTRLYKNIKSQYLLTGWKLSLLAVT